MSKVKFKGIWTGACGVRDAEVMDLESGKIVELKEAVASEGKLRVDLAEFRGSAGIQACWMKKK
jgi:hypothetical protein